MKGSTKRGNCETNIKLHQQNLIQTARFAIAVKKSTTKHISEGNINEHSSLSAKNQVTQSQMSKDKEQKGYDFGLTLLWFLIKVLIIKYERFFISLFKTRDLKSVLQIAPQPTPITYKHKK